jgi:hypothetical protein
MTTSSAPKKTATSPCGRNSKNHVTDKSRYCRECDKPIHYSSQIYPNLEFPDMLLVCPSCGHENEDVSGFYIVESKTGNIASPPYLTEAEIDQFAGIFGLSGQGSHHVISYTSYFNGQRDQQRRRAHLDRLSRGRQVLTRLIESAPACHETEDLKRLAISLGFNGYALPIFQELPATMEVE